MLPAFDFFHELSRWSEMVRPAIMRSEPVDDVVHDESHGATVGQDFYAVG